jgi:hypothetical protein
VITASALSRLLNCPGASVLARAETVSVWADAGHDEHAELADALAAGTLPAWIAAVVPTDARAEVALAFDVATRQGRIIGENLDRSYGDIGPFEIVGSCDVLGVDQDAVILLDYKTGFADVEPAATNAQLAFYAIAAARALNKDRAIIRIVYTKTQRIDEADLDALDLAAFADRLERLHTRVVRDRAADASTISTREGPWCKHCPSKARCPSKIGLLSQVAAGGLAVIGETELTPERAGAAIETLLRLEQIVEEAKKRAIAYVSEVGPVDLGDGRMFGRYLKPGNRKIDAAKAEAVVRELLGPEAAQVAIERSTSQAAIERACKMVAATERGAASKLKAQVMAALEADGAVKRDDTYPVGVFPAGKYEPVRVDAEELHAEADRLLRSA